MSQRFVVQVGDSTLEVEVTTDAEGNAQAVVDGELLSVRNHGTERTIVRAVGGTEQVAVVLDDARAPTLAAVGGVAHGVVVKTKAEHERDEALGSALGGAGSGRLAAPMPGRVVKILVASGDTVELGQPLIIVEAMKMENELAAPIAGTIESIDVETGQAVDAGQALCVVAPHEDSTPS